MNTSSFSAPLPTSSPSHTTPQNGILDGLNPTVWDPKNPITVFMLQAGLIIVVCRLLSFPLSLVRQPKVIAEVIGGIILGPSCLGRIPGFTTTIFSANSMPVLNAAANLGLIFFLFLVGLEVDFRVFAYNWKIAASVGAAGMIVPFALGAAISRGLYSQFNSEVSGESINFGVYLLFIGVAMAITAFPVLCRILTELKLLKTPVGVIVLSAGVGNDVVGWILLALCVALINSSKALTVLYILLLVIGYILFVIFAVRPLLIAILRKTGSLQSGPTQPVMALLILLILASAFFTDIIALHPIFGAFLVGLICPHDGGFAIKCAEKLEDVITTLLLPLYFALSGLNTNLALLNDGITWAYVIGVTSVAFFGKVVGGTLAAKVNQLEWRESLAVGVFMSCKGLVELIVLNIGLQAGILSQTSFTIFVVMALATTCATTPLVRWFYSDSYQEQVELARNRARTSPLQANSATSDCLLTRSTSDHKRVLVYLRNDNLSAAIKAASLITVPNSASLFPEMHHTRKVDNKLSQSRVHVLSKQSSSISGLRLRPITERVSSIMEVAEATQATMTDPVLSVFHAFGKLINVHMDSSLVFTQESLFGAVLTERAAQTHADLLLIPWNVSSSFEHENSRLFNPLDRLADEQFNSVMETVLSSARTNIVLYLSGFGAPKHDTIEPEIKQPYCGAKTHIVMLFVGGADDRLALSLVLQMTKAPTTTATVFRVKDTSSENPGAQQDSIHFPKEDEYYAEAKATISDSIKNSIVFAELRVSGPAYAVEMHTLLREEISASRSNQAEPDCDTIFVVGQSQENLSRAMAADFLGDNRTSWEASGLVARMIMNFPIQTNFMIVKAKS